MHIGCACDVSRMLGWVSPLGHCSVAWGRSAPGVAPTQASRSHLMRIQCVLCFADIMHPQGPQAAGPSRQTCRIPSWRASWRCMPRWWRAGEPAHLARRFHHEPRGCPSHIEGQGSWFRTQPGTTHILTSPSHCQHIVTTSPGHRHDIARALALQPSPSHGQGNVMATPGDVMVM